TLHLDQRRHTGADLDLAGDRAAPATEDGEPVVEAPQVRRPLPGLFRGQIRRHLDVNRCHVSPLPHRSVRINGADDFRLPPPPARTVLVTSAPRAPTPCRPARGVGAQRLRGYSSTAVSVVEKISAP